MVWTTESLAELAPAEQHDASPEERFRHDVLAGLGQQPKQIPSKYFYDAEGSRLFEAITEQPEYYPTRTELALLERYGAEMAQHLGRGCALIEYGSGSGRKTPLLLKHLEAPVAYLPVEIDPHALEQSVEALRRTFPTLPLVPICADYTRPFELPAEARGATRAVFFPGSTIGNFEPAEAKAFLQMMRFQVGRGGAVLLGVDLRKDPTRLHRAYNDVRGVTAAFNKNLMVRVKRSFDADIDLGALAHYAFYAPDHGRIEMHLVSLREQRFELAGQEVVLHAGESIRTEYSYKYTPMQIQRLALAAGLRRERSWVDDEGLFSLNLLRAR